MPSQNKIKRAAVLIAPAQNLDDGTLLVLSESSSTFPKIKTQVIPTVIGKPCWEDQIKKKWGNRNFMLRCTRVAKTYTTNRPYNYPDITWDKNIKEIKAAPPSLPPKIHPSS